MPIGDLARQDDYPVDPMTGIPIGAPLVSLAPSVGGLGDILAPAPQGRKSLVRHRTASPLVNITEADIQDAMRMALALRRNRMGGLAAQDGYGQ